MIICSGVLIFGLPGRHSCTNTVSKALPRDKPIALIPIMGFQNELALSVLGSCSSTTTTTTTGSSRLRRPQEAARLSTNCVVA